METENLIRDLARRSVPVEPLNSVWLRSCVWFVLSAIFVMAGVSVIRPRPDWVSLLPTLSFLLQFLLPLAVTLIAAISVFRLSVPDEELPSTLYLPGLITGIWIGGAIWMISWAKEPDAGMGWNCVRNIFLLGLPPTIFLFWLLKKASPLKPERVGLLATLSAATLACAGTRFICRNDDPLHFFAWHCLPVWATSLMGLHWGAKLLIQRDTGVWVEGQISKR